MIGVLEGTDEPERKVILSNHHDAWVYGGVDPSSGTATALEMGRALGELREMAAGYGHDGAPPPEAPAEAGAVETPAAEAPVPAEAPAEELPAER